MPSYYLQRIYSRPYFDLEDMCLSFGVWVTEERKEADAGLAMRKFSKLWSMSTWNEPFVDWSGESSGPWSRFSWHFKSSAFTLE